MKLKTIKTIAASLTVLLTVAILLVSILVSPVAAQGGWTLTYDFTTGSQRGWTIEDGSAAPLSTYTGSSFTIQCSTPAFTGSGSTITWIADVDTLLTLPAASTVTSMDVDFDLTKGTSLDEDFGLRLITYPSTYGAFGSTVLSSGASTVGRAVRSYSWTGTTATYLRFIWSAGHWRSSYGGCLGSPNIHVYSITVHGTGTPPFTPTPTPTITPTFVPGPMTGTPGSGGTLGKVCQLIGLDSSTFTSNPGNWKLATGNILTPQINSPGLSLPEGSATLNLSLDPQKEYTWQVNYHIGNTSGAPDAFSVQLGTDPITSIPIAATLAEQTYTSPMSTYHPNTGNSFSFVIEKAFQSPDPQLIVDFACVSTTNTDAGGGPQVPAYLQADCSYCVYNPTGDILNDAGLLFSWLICFLSQIWNCAFKTFAGGIWLAVANVVAFLAVARLWASKTIENASATGESDIGIGANWLIGVLTNIITGAFNFLSGFFNQLGIGNFFNTLLLIFLAIITAILQAIQGLATLLSSGLQSITNLLSVPLAFLSHVWNAVTNFLGVIPKIITSIVDGFNQSSSIPSYAANCADPSSPLYTPCLGMYVLDNTIFAGPVYYLMPLAMGFVAFNTLLWTIRAVSEAMDKS